MTDVAGFDDRPARIEPAPPVTDATPESDERAPDAVIARYPGLICVAAAADPAPVAHLLGLCARSAGPAPGRTLARGMAAWLSGPDAPGTDLRFGTIADAGDGRCAVFLLGAVRVRIGDQELSGAEQAAWTDRLLDPTADTDLLLTLDDGTRPADPADRADPAVAVRGVLGGLHDLRAGVVPGRGVRLGAVPAGAGRGDGAPELPAAPILPATAPLVPTPAVPTPAVPTPAVPTLAVSTPAVSEPVASAGPVDAEQAPPRRARRAEAILGVAPDGPRREPLEAGLPLTAAALPAPARGGPDDRGDRAGPGGPIARGHRCSRGHLNDPRSLFCVLCGIRMSARTGILVAGSRPPLGLLVFDDGATYTVDAEYLVGRIPDVDDRVRQGVLRAIVVEDRTGAVSRVHAEIRIQDWDVLLVDAGSSNGTSYTAPGSTAWSPAPPRRGLRLLPGTRVRMGQRTFLFESPSGGR